jgi:hypothetical protein
MAGISGGLKALLCGIVDYAGLFPPARLPLEQAITNYERYRRDPDAWMLGKFICPAPQLEALSVWVENLFVDGPPLAVSVLGRGGAPEEFGPNVRKDLADMAAFAGRHPGRGVVDAYEVKVASPVEIAIEAIQKNSDDLPASYVEIHPATEDSIKHAVDAIGRLNRREVGFKLRCGGVEAGAFPSARRVASAIGSCRDAGVPMKFTAGLHHPFRLDDPEIKVRMHGFVNVFAAGLLAGVNNLSAEQIEEIVGEEERRSFQIDDQGLSCRGHKMELAAIQSGRRERMIAFGSCSFDEPRDDLREFGFFPPRSP